MVELRLVQVDAFADRPFTGNPAAVMPLEEWLPDEVMQAIATSETMIPSAASLVVSPSTRRTTARQAMAIADRLINMAWTSAAKASALPWPKR